MRKPELIKSLIYHGFDKKIISAFEKVERENFVLPGNEEFAYDDTPLPIGHEQTISQPYTIAFMISLLEAGPGQKVLEIGSGSGYVLALLNELTKGGEIYGVEIIPELLERSKGALKDYENIEIFQAEKMLGLPKLAPFDRILVSAAATKVPGELLSQLKDGGILVCPVNHDIIKIKKEKTGNRQTSFSGFSFVPLIE